MSERTVLESYNLESLYKVLMTVTEGKEIIPAVADYEKRGYPFTFAPVEYLESPAGKIDLVLHQYLDFEGDDVIKAEDAQMSMFERAEKKFIVSQKKISNHKVTLAQIEAKIIPLQNEQTKIFEKALQVGLNEELQKRGQELQTEKNKYEYLKKLFTNYEQILLKELKIYESEYQSEFRKVFGERLRQARIAKNLTIDATGQAINLKRLTINIYELGHSDPSAFNLYRLCKLLNISPNWLLGIEDKEQKQ